MVYSLKDIKVGTGVMAGSVDVTSKVRHEVISSDLGDESAVMRKQGTSPGQEILEDMKQERAKI